MSPKRWVEIQLDEVCSLITDGTHHSPPNLVDGEFRYITAKNIRPNGIDLSDVTSVSRRVHQEIYARCPAEFEDVLYIKDGVTTGLAAINSLHEPISLLSSVALLKPIREILDPHFLKHWLNSPEIKRRMTGEMTGTAIKRLVLRQIRSAKFNLPPLPEQRHIVAKIEALMARSRAARKALEAIPTLMDHYRKSILNAAVTGGLTKDWRDADPKRESAERKSRLIKISKTVKTRTATMDSILKSLGLEKLPSGWSWVHNCQLAQKSPSAICAGPFGTIFKAKDFRPQGIPIIFLRHIGEGKFLQRKPGFMDPGVWREHHQPYSVHGGELLVTKLGDPPGTACIYPTNQGVAMVTPDVIKISVDDKVAETRYLMHFFNSSVSKRIVRELAFGVTRLRIDLAMFKTFPIPLPPLEEQQEIVRRVDQLFEVLACIEEGYNGALNQVASLDQSILAKAFRGELVPQEPSDEPAEVLLARIRGSRETQGAPARRRGRPAAAPAPVPAPRPVPAPVALDRAAEEIQAYAADAPARVNLEALDTDALMAAFRQTLATQESWDTDEDLLRSLAQRFGYQRLGSRAKETLKGHLRAALLRRIAVREPDGTLALGPRTLDAYTRDELIDCIPSVLRKGQTLASEDLMRALLHHLGFQRLTDAAQEALKSAFNAAIRRGVLGTEGTARVRRGP